MKQRSGQSLAIRATQERVKLHVDLIGSYELIVHVVAHEESYVAHDTLAHVADCLYVYFDTNKFV